MIFEDSQEFLQKLFDIAKKESIYISQKKIQAAPRQITLTLFIIINKIVLLDIFVQLIRQENKTYYIFKTKKIYRFNSNNSCLFSISHSALKKQ